MVLVGEKTKVHSKTVGERNCVKLEISYSILSGDKILGRLSGGAQNFFEFFPVGNMRIFWRGSARGIEVNV